MKKQRYPSFIFILSSVAVLVALVGGTWSTASGANLMRGGQLNLAAFVTPTFQIVSVQTDQTVTIQTANFPANDAFNVLMNTMGTHGVGGYNVGSVSSGSGGSITFTFNIPAELKGQRLIAIRLESPTSGYFSYNWFTNNTAGSSGGIPNTGGLPAGVIPTFAINSVTPDTNVTINTSNFPANDTFRVLMNTMGTRGVGGYVVDTIASGSGGSFSKTFNIPAELKGQRQIAIRLESTASGHFSYNWFWNSTSGTSGTGGIPETGGTGLPAGVIPTFSISGVTPDDSVTIQTANFPANDTFDVLMNTIGTRGVGGTKVDTISSGSGGTLNLTFKIPAGLKGQRQIAIRLQSPNSGYFSYNWFWNTSTTGTGGIPETGGVPSLPPGVIPTISITAVSQDNTVTIQTSNYPANDTYSVLMGPFGSKGVNGTNVGTFNSGAGGTQTATFNIPSNLKGASQIAIRLESPKSGYFSFNWFYNRNSP